MFDISVTLDDQLVVNIFLHVTILFIFLYYFFFLIISKKGEEVLNNNLDGITRDKVPVLLKEIDDLDTQKMIDWDKFYKTCQEIHDNPNPIIDQKIKNNNEYYKSIGMWIGGSLLLLTIIVYCYYTFYKGSYIDIKTIIFENIITFMLIGAIEYVFFQQTASNYIPAYPTSIGGIVLDRMKENVKTI